MKAQTMSSFQRQQIMTLTPNKHFLYFEELELARRLKKDESLAWCKKSIVYHAQGGSTSTPALQARSCYHAAFSAFAYTRQHHPLCLPSVIISRLIGTVLRTMSRRQPQLLIAAFMAVSDFLIGREASYGEE